MLQLASQQPDNGAVFRARCGPSSRPVRTLKWRNKPQEADACIATLTHKSDVNALAVSKTRILGASATSVFVYDAETEELLQELEGEGDVQSVAISDDAALEIRLFW